MVSHGRAICAALPPNSGGTFQPRVDTVTVRLGLLLNVLLNRRATQVHNKVHNKRRTAATVPRPVRVLSLLLALDGLTQDSRCAAVIVGVATVPGGDRVRANGEARS